LGFARLELGRTSVLVVSLLVSWMLPLFSLQAQDCSTLAESVSKRYTELAQKAAEAYVDGDYETSIEFGREAMSICTTTEVTEYNLARAYQQAGLCAMARYHFDRLSARKLSKDMAKKVKKYEKQAAQDCPTATRFTVTCAEAEVELELGPFPPQSCPMEGMLPAGEFRLEARQEGRMPFSERVTLQEGVENVLTVPALVPERIVGSVEVSCSPGVAFFRLNGPNGEQTLSCPWIGELEVGVYRLIPEGSEDVFQAVVEAKMMTSVFLEVQRTPFERAGLVLALRMAPGFGYASGPLYDDGKATGESVSSISHVSFSSSVELGYAFNPSWALLGRARIDQNLGIVGGLLARFVPWLNEDWAIRADAGVGFGVLKQPVFLTDGRVPETEAGPVFLLLGSSVAYGLSDLAALVFGLDLNADLNSDFALHADLSVGLELRF
jgi:hypothetical protein